MTASLSPLDRFAQQADQLYSLPAVALEVVRLAGQPQVDPRQLKLVLESDPALAARILKVVNSSLFGLSRQVSDLQQALALLGLKPLKALLLGFSLPPNLLRGIHAEALQQYWQHTLLKAVACRLLEQNVAQSDEEEAFIAGLLQDVGILALLQQLGENYATLYMQTRERGGDLLAAELPTLGFDHLSLSARMLMNWRLPPKVCQAVSVPANETAVEHAPTPSRQLCQILHVAELLTRYIKKPHDAELAELLEIGQRYFEMGPVRLHSVVKELTPHFESLSNVLAIELPSGPTSQELLSAAHRRLATITAEMVPELVQLQRAASEHAGLDSLLQTTRELQLAAQHAARPGVDLKHVEQKHLDAKHGEHRTDSGSEHLHPAVGSPLRRTSAPTPAATHSPPPRATADLGLIGRVAGVLQNCRQSRSPLSLAILQLDHFADAQFVCGVEPAILFLEHLRRHLAETTGGLGPCLQLNSTRYALLWGDCSRSDALATLRNVQDQLPDWQDECLPQDAVRLSVSAGLATVSLPSRNFPPADLIAAAERCLDGALHSGGNTIKSIEL